MKVARLHDTLEHVTPLALGNGTRLAQPGTILMVVRGMSLAHSFPVAIVEKPVAFNQDLKAFVPNPDVDGEYVLRWLQANQSALLSLATEASHGTKRIPTGDLLATHIALPRLAEQREISSALADVDRLLEALEALIAKKRTIKQAAMREFLTGKIRLSGFDDPWRLGRLSDFGDLRSGNGFPISFQGHQSGDHPFFKVSDISNKGNELFLKTANHRISEDSRRALGATIFPTGSVVFCKIGAAIFLERRRLLSQASCLDNNMMAFSVTTPNACERFFYYLFLCIELSKLVSTTALPSLSSRDVGAICVSLPPMDEQCAITRILTDMDGEIGALDRCHEKVHAIKQCMLQQLVMGRVRLVKTEEITEPTETSVLVPRKHNWYFNDAVVISVLAQNFGTEQYPLGRMRYTKLLYLLHRHTEGHAEGYLKKAVGPYNPRNRYGGPEGIALEKGYIRKHKVGKFQGFVADSHIGEAEVYFDKWYGKEVLQWLDQFRYKKNDDLELLTTVDMAAEELRAANKEVSVESVKDLLLGHEEWKAKIGRRIFADTNLARAIEDSRSLFGVSGDRSTG